MGKVEIPDENLKYIKEVNGEYSGSIINHDWNLPIGAFGKGGGAI